MKYMSYSVRKFRVNRRIVEGPDIPVMTSKDIGQTVTVCRLVLSFLFANERVYDPTAGLNDVLFFFKAQDPVNVLKICI